ncbi:thymidylate synthase [Candidatus Saccharibacteria bacterium]|nr:thymidylate synthase [Candidatus Saccharibacteria bacterium]
MSRFDDQYIDLCRRILDHGEKITNYKKVDSRSAATSSSIPDHAAQASSAATTFRLPHETLSFNLEEEFPILVSKQVGFKTAVLELLWIYQVASNDVSWLHDRNVKIWNEWEIPASGIYQGRDFKKLYKKAGLSESPVGTIGTAYGWIVRRYSLVENLLETLKQNPGNRRMVLSLWQNEWLPTAALPSCVWNSMWNLVDGRLNLLVTSRSSDVPLGLPFNIVQYATFCYLIAHVLGVRPGQFTFVTNDAHIYANQIDGIREQIRRYDEAKSSGTLPPAPTLWLNPEIKDFYAFDNSRELKDIRLDDYQNLGRIIMPVTE